MSSRPQIFAHRGARRVAPENTLPAFAAALDMGADGIELDVHRTIDGRLVVIGLQGGSPEGYSKVQPWNNSAFTPEPLVSGVLRSTTILARPAIDGRPEGSGHAS